MISLTYRFYYLLDGAWRHRYVIVLPILLLPFVGLLVGVTSPKQYVAHTRMLIQETAKMNPFLEDLAVSSMLKERMDALQTLLHSRHILGSVAQQRGLVDEQTPPAQYDEVVAQLSSGLSVNMAGKDLIRIDFNANNPEGMKQTLEIVSQQFIEQLLAPERSSMKDSSRFLAEHLETRREELEQAESKLAAFKDKHPNELPELHLTNISRLAQLRQRLAEREAELAGASKSLGGIDQQLSKTNPVVGRIEEQIIRLRSELALLRARYTDNHSSIQGVLRNLRRLEEERRSVLSANEEVVNTDQLWDIVSSSRINNDGDSQPLLISQLQNLQSARSQVDALQEETRSLKTMIKQLEQQTSGFAAHEQQLINLERGLKVKTELYEDLLQRHEMARVTGSLGLFEQEKRVKIIDQAFTPNTPTNLPLIMFIIAGLIGGCALGGGMATMLELGDSTIRRREQLEALTGVPVLSRIPPMDESESTTGLLSHAS